MWEGLMWGGGLISEKDITNKMTSVIGPVAFENFRDSVYKNYITRADIKRISDECYNVVRIPFNHNLLEDDANPYVGIALTDSVVAFPYTADSTTPTTGGVQLLGGMGVAKNIVSGAIISGEDLHATSTTDAVPGVSSGALSVAGGGTIGKNLVTQGRVIVEDDTDAAGASSSIYSAGGLETVKGIWAGTFIGAGDSFQAPLAQADEYCANGGPNAQPIKFTSMTSNPSGLYTALYTSSSATAQTWSTLHTASPSLAIHNTMLIRSGQNAGVTDTLFSSTVLDLGCDMASSTVPHPGGATLSSTVQFFYRNDSTTPISLAVGAGCTAKYDTTVPFVKGTYTFSCVRTVDSNPGTYDVYCSRVVDSICHGAMTQVASLATARTYTVAELRGGYIERIVGVCAGVTDITPSVADFVAAGYRAGDQLTVVFRVDNTNNSASLFFNGGAGSVNYGWTNRTSNGVGTGTRVTQTMLFVVTSDTAGAETGYILRTAATSSAF
jgi:hypothetical protein